MAKKKMTKKKAVRKTRTKPASKTALTPEAEKLRREGIAIADANIAKIEAEERAQAPSNGRAAYEKPSRSKQRDTGQTSAPRSKTGPKTGAKKAIQREGRTAIEQRDYRWQVVVSRGEGETR